MKSTKTLRKVNIDGEIWNYIIDRKFGIGKGNKIRIYDVDGKLHRVPKNYILEFGGINSIAYSPYYIKKYIIKYIKT